MGVVCAMPGNFQRSLSMSGSMYMQYTQLSESVHHMRSHARIESALMKVIGVTTFKIIVMK